jgi:dTDP-4-amino-4,6-dideoxygalactose transaminase
MTLNSLTQPNRCAPFSPWPYYAPDEVDAVVRVMESGKVNYWTGQEAREFEREYATAASCEKAIALCNGTTALELAIHALEIPPGSEIITSPRTFIASASCAVMRGCIPVLADVDPVSQNITAETIERVITKRTKAIIPVHLGGWPCDMDPIMDLAARHGIKVIEDCAQASGATYKGRPVGSLGHVGAFSFCQDKIITTGGEGGMLTTNDPDLWSRAWSFKDHGKSWDAVYNHKHSPGFGFKWLHESFGTNWRMTEIHAAIGRAQLRKLPEWTLLRQENLRRLNAAFSAFKCIRTTPAPAGIGHAGYKAYVFVRPEQLKDGWNRDRIMVEINARNIPCLSGSCSEIYLEKAFTQSGLGPTHPLPVAHELGETSLMFQIHPTLTKQNMDETIAVSSEVFQEASR